MTNVIKVFGALYGKPLSGCEARISETVMMITGLSSQLARLLGQLQVHLDDIDRVIDSLEDEDMRKLLRQKASLHRNGLAEATAALSVEVRKLAPLHNRLVRNVEAARW